MSSRHYGFDRRTAAARDALPAACACLVLASIVLCLPNPSNAEGLRDALRSAYETNPLLDAERARLRATDEGVARARSGYRPDIRGDAFVRRTDTSSDPRTNTDGERTTSHVELNLSQPVFTGFRTTNAISRAEANVRAGRENLRNVETTTMLNAATAYLDVVRDQAIVRLRQRNVSVLTRELQAARARRAVNEVTITDVAQARARRARAIADSDAAKSDLRVARASYRQIIGHAPGTIGAPPQHVPGLPKSLKEALTIANHESPVVIAALYQEQAARHQVDEVWGELLPSVNLEANYTYETNPTRQIDSNSSASVTGRLTVPLYQRGDVHARVRQAKHTHVSLLQEVEQARTLTEANVTAAWSRLVAARARLRSAGVQVNAARTALEGVREEEKVGQRTLLDVLNAEQEYLDAQVDRVVTRRDLLVASYALLASLGRLTARWIDEIPNVYDPEINHAEVRGRWVGTSISDRPWVPATEEIIYDEADYEGAEPAPVKDVQLAPSIPPVQHPEAMLFDMFKKTLR